MLVRKTAASEVFGYMGKACKPIIAADNYGQVAEMLIFHTQKRNISSETHSERTASDLSFFSEGGCHKYDRGGYSIRTNARRHWNGSTIRDNRDMSN